MIAGVLASTPAGTVVESFGASLAASIAMFGGVAHAHAAAPTEAEQIALRVGDRDARFGMFIH
jgi:hypothetical protein